MSLKNRNWLTSEIEISSETPPKRESKIFDIKIPVEIKKYYLENCRKNEIIP